MEDVLEVRKEDKIPARASMLDIGSTVVVETKGFTKSVYEMAMLEAISPAKLLQTVTLANGRKLQFWPDGNLYSQDNKFGMKLLLPTERLTAYIIRQNRIQFMKEVLWQNVPTSYVEAMLRILVTPEQYEEEELLHLLPKLGL